MNQKEINKSIKEGFVQVIVTFEVVGKPVTHVEGTLRKYIAELKKNKAFIIIQDEFGAPEEHEDGMFSVFYESEMLVKTLEDLVWLSINYSPASIEFMEPGELRLKSQHMTNWFNDLLSRLHEMGIRFKQMTSVNKEMIKNLNGLIQNSILLAVDTGAETPAAMAQKVGIGKSHLEPFLKHFVEKKVLKKTGQKYARA